MFTQNPDGGQICGNRGCALAYLRIGRVHTLYDPDGVAPILISQLLRGHPVGVHGWWSAIVRRYAKAHPRLPQIGTPTGFYRADRYMNSV